jgi:hypothetical protein
MDLSFLRRSIEAAYPVGAGRTRTTSRLGESAGFFPASQAGGRAKSGDAARAGSAGEAARLGHSHAASEAGDQTT